MKEACLCLVFCYELVLAKPEFYNKASYCTFFPPTKKGDLKETD